MFADSFSQAAGPLGNTQDDTLEQSHWQEEATVLWEVTTRRAQSFDFLTIYDILKENARQKREIQDLNDIIQLYLTESMKSLKIFTKSQWVPS